MRTVRLMAELGDGVRHAVLSLDGEQDAASLVPDTVSLELLPSFPKAGTLTTARRLRALFRERRPDLVLTYNWGALDAVLAARLPPGFATIHHEDGFGPDEAAGFKRRRVLARRIALRGVKAVVVPSHTLEELALDTWKLPARIVRRIPNGVRTERFPPADGNAGLRSELGIDAEAFVVGFVGHLRREKNPMRFLESFALLAEQPSVPSPHALVLGTGAEGAALRERTLALGLSDRVHLVGHREDTPRYYRAMDAFCISSDTEQMPVALLEAMSAELPTVATDVGDIRRILPSSASEYLVDPGEAKAAELLARGLAKLASDRNLRAHLGRDNRARVREAYSFDAMVDAYRALFESSLQARA